MKLTRGHEPGARSERRDGPFTGEVWLDPALTGERLSVNSVTFLPAARTHWHRHEIAQVLHVTQGLGLIWSAETETGFVLSPGDIVHIPGGERHWHGAGPQSLLTHLAISVGETEWLEAVADGDYERARGALLDTP